MTSMQEDEKEKVVDIHDLTFYYPKMSTLEKAPTTPALINFNLVIHPGQRCLVVGGNGAGKSSLLRIIGGKHLIHDNESGGYARVLGKDAFRDTTLNFVRTYVSADWGQKAGSFDYSVALVADIAVCEMMVALQAQFPARRDRLIQALRIDVNWRMYKLSDGQRRRVQLFLALIRPSRLIILDEVLGLLDILARQDLLAYLKEESEVNAVTIVMASNIFDGLSDWASHLAYVKAGKVTYTRLEECNSFVAHQKAFHPEPLMKTVEEWLRAELADKKFALEKEGGALASLSAQDSAGGYANGRLVATLLD